MMVSANFGGNVHDTVNALNKLGVTRYVHSFVPVSAGATIVVYDFRDYPTYCHFCERMKQKPVSVEQFSGACLDTN